MRGVKIVNEDKKNEENNLNILNKFTEEKVNYMKINQNDSVFEIIFKNMKVSFDRNVFKKYC